MKKWDPTAASSDAAGGAAAPTPTPAAPPRAGLNPLPAGPAPPKAGPTPAGPTTAAPAAATPATDNSSGGPKGPGWIVQIRGYHYHNADRENQADEYVRGTLIRQLREGSLQLPAGAGATSSP